MNSSPQNNPSRRTVLKSIGVTTTLAASGLLQSMIIACAKGLDVYAEKSLSFSIPEGRALVKAVRKHKRVLQVGTQQRSTSNNQYSCEFVRNGGLGKVHTILVKNYSGSRAATGLDKQAVPEGMDWNRFCDQAQLLDYHEQLHRR